MPFYTPKEFENGDPYPTLHRCWIRTPDGRRLEFFYNEESGLVVVDVVDADGEGGREILRTNIDSDRGQRWVAESLEA